MGWLEAVSCFFVLSGIYCAVRIGFDLDRHRQSMKVMNPVWVLSALWGHWFILRAYYAFGRENAAAPMRMKPGMKMEGMESESSGSPGKKRSRSQSIALSTLHCGAGCTLGDLVGEWFVFFVPVAVAGSLVAGSWILDYGLALVFGVGFQYAAIRGMERVSRREAVGRALKADILSLTAWQVGMYGWMAVVMFVPLLPMLSRTSWTFWFMMQIAMGFGFLFSYPMNALLIRRGVKKPM